MIKEHKSHFAWLQLLIVIVLVLGVFFRFINLDRKVYWHDETFTSLRISGYTASEVVQQVFDGNEIGVEDLQKYQRINPEKGIIDTINGLAREEPQHPPLYFVMARFWVQWFGDSVAVTRSLSALISLFVFPCLYWVCIELFKSPITGWLAIAIIAVSPIHVLYAQEAREYSLWTVTILLSSAALLRALRLKTKLSWAMYAVTVAVGLYSFLLSVLVLIAQGIYVIITEGFRLSRTTAAYLLALLAGLLASIPWLLICFTNLSAVNSGTNWSHEKIGLLSSFKAWSADLSRVFLDFNIDSANPSIYLLALVPIPLILVGYSIYFLCSQSPQRVWLFILTLIGVTASALILPDLILGGKLSTTNRYLFPSYLGIQLAIAYLLAAKITSISINPGRQRLWRLVMILLLSGGVLSCAISSQAESWWNKVLPQAPSIINQTNQPLLISDSLMGDILSISYLLDPKVRLLLVNEPNTFPDKIPDRFSDVFLYTPSEELKSGLEKEQNYKIKLVYQGKFDSLWRLAK